MVKSNLGLVIKWEVEKKNHIHVVPKKARRGPLVTGSHEGCRNQIQVLCQNLKPVVLSADPSLSPHPPFLLFFFCLATVG